MVATGKEMVREKNSSGEKSGYFTSSQGEMKF